MINTRYELNQMASLTIIGFRSMLNHDKRIS